MTTKKLYIIRHGETELNKKGIAQGSGVDSKLNEIGKQQALAFFNSYQHIPFDKVYTSLLQRTHQSVAHFLEKQIAWQQFGGLNEISWGEREGRPLTSQDDQEYFAILDAWQNGDLYAKTKGGESPIEVYERQKEALTQIMAHTDEKNILICMHGRAMRVFLCLLLDLPLINMKNFAHTNLCLYTLLFDGKKFSLELSNNTDHLHHNLDFKIHHKSNSPSLGSF